MVAVMFMSVARFFAAPATVAGYALVDGIIKEALPSEIWRQIFCIVSGGFLARPPLRD